MGPLSCMGHGRGDDFVKELLEGLEHVRLHFVQTRIRPFPLNHFGLEAAVLARTQHEKDVHFEKAALMTPPSQSVNLLWTGDIESAVGRWVDSVARV